METQALGPVRPPLPEASRATHTHRRDSEGPGMFAAWRQKRTYASTQANMPRKHKTPPSRPTLVRSPTRIHFRLVKLFIKTYGFQQPPDRFAPMQRELCRGLVTSFPELALFKSATLYRRRGPLAVHDIFFACSTAI